MAGRLGVAGAGWHGIAGRHGVARSTGARASRLAIAWAGGLGIAWACGLGIFAVPELSEPVVDLKHAGVLWLDLDLHVEPPVEPGGEPGRR